MVEYQTDRMTNRNTLLPMFSIIYLLSYNINLKFIINTSDTEVIINMVGSNDTFEINFYQYIITDSAKLLKHLSKSLTDNLKKWTFSVEERR